MDGKEIEIKVSYESKDYWRNALGYYFSYNTFAIFFWTFAFFGTFLSFWFLRGDVQIWHFLEILCAAFVFMCCFGLIMSSLVVAGAKRTQESSCEFTFSGESIVVRSKLFASQLDWAYFIRAKETGNYFIFYLKSGQSTLLPKRFFRDYAEITEFKGLLQSKMGEKVRLKKSKENLGLK